MSELDSIKSIKDALAPAHWNQARRDFLARFIVALLTAQTACLYRLASLFPSQAQIASRYHRIRRFFSAFDLDQSDFAKIILSLAIKAGVKPPFILSFDRTEWYLGTVSINIFMIGIVYKQIAFPLLWIMLDKAGSSDAKERIDLLAKAITFLGKESIAFVLGDREFACHDLLKWLHQEKIGYRLRLRSDILVTNGQKEQVTAGWLFHRFALGKEQDFEKARQCLGHSVFLAGMRLVNDKGKKDYLIVVSNEPAPLSDYALRWSIENLFSGLKSRGFDLEATHLLENERISRLLSVLALAFCWSVVVGMADFEQREREGRPMRKKGHGRFGVSAFRNGLDRLRSLLAPLAGHFDAKGLQSAIQFLYGT